jgi:integrase
MAIKERKLKDGSIVYRVEVKDPQGKWYPKKQFSRKVDAKLYEASLFAQKGRGEVATEVKHRELTLSEYYHATWKIEARTKVTLGWRASENQMFRDHIEPYLGKAKVIDIHKRDIAKLLADLQEIKGLGGQTVKHVYTMLHGIFKYAIEISEIRDSNPVLGKFKPQVKEYVPKYLKPEDARDFLEAVADHWLGPAIWIMVGTGIRVCELIGLQYGDLDIGNNRLFLRRQWRRKEKRIAEVKNKKAEKPLPIASELAEYLERKLSTKAENTDWVIQSKRYPGEMASYYTIYNTLKALCKQHRFPLLSPHGLRHTTSGIWNERGARKDDLRDLYNHKHESTTERYNHEVPDRLVELARGVRLRKQKTQLSLIK